MPLDPLKVKRKDDIKQETPWVYKDSRPIAQPQVDAGIVRSVAEFRPILMVKG